MILSFDSFNLLGTLYASNSVEQRTVHQNPALLSLFLKFAILVIEKFGGSIIVLLQILTEMNSH